jgi:hypothetical protein
MLTGLGALSAPALVCAGFAGLAVFLVLRDPAGQLRRLTRRRSRVAEVVAPLVRLIAGRADAPPLMRRALLSMACALALGLAGAGIDGWLGRLSWFVVPLVTATGVLTLGWVEPQSSRHRRQQLIMDVPQALELMAVCLGAGLPARTACAAVVGTCDGPVADDLARCWRCRSWVLLMRPSGGRSTIIRSWVSRLGTWRGRWSREPQ